MLAPKSRADEVTDVLAIAAELFSGATRKDDRAEREPPVTVADEAGFVPKMQLTWDVFVAPEFKVVSSDLPPGLDTRTWAPTTATLISGDTDAVLVDAMLTISQAEALANWVEAKEKNLTTVYVTHGHGDHFFGLAPILDRFPRAVATPAAIDESSQAPRQSNATGNRYSRARSPSRTARAGAARWRAPLPSGAHAYAD